MKKTIGMVMVLLMMSAEVETIKLSLSPKFLWRKSIESYVLRYGQQNICESRVWLPRNKSS